MRGSFTLLASQILFAAVPLIDPLLAADLGEAAVATISFANRLVLGLQGLLGVAVQRTSLPMLALLAAQDAVGSRRVALRWALLAAGAGIFIGVAVLTFADALVSLLLERGRFTAENRAAVAQLVRIGALQLPCFMAGLVLVAALAAQGRRAELAWVAIAGVTVKCVFSAALAPAHGLAGLMLSTAFMYLATALVAWFCVVRKPAT